jgi:hypothetical protein
MTHGLAECPVSQETQLFPVHTLPLRLRCFVEESSKSLTVSPDMMALAVLATTSAAIGKSRRIKLKGDWEEPAALYAAIIAETGSMKSPALAAATAPLKAYQTEARRTWTSDTTVEALAVLLRDHPRGLLVINDEITAWINSLNQYKNGKGSDREFYLSAWNGSDIAVDRKGDPPLLVRRPFLSVIGTTTPGSLGTLATPDRLEDGFIQRLLFAWPGNAQVKWTDMTISDVTMASYHALLSDLLSLDGCVHPITLTLAADAQNLFRHWHDEHYEEMDRLSLPFLRGFYSKLKGYCARLALIHAVSEDPETELVGEDSVEAALEQVEYFKTQAEHVAKEVCRYVGGPEAVRLMKCQEAIKRVLNRRGPCARRTVFKLLNYEAAIFTPAWESLCRPQIVEDPPGLFTLIAPSGTDIPTTDKPSEVAARLS